MAGPRSQSLVWRNDLAPSAVHAVYTSPVGVTTLVKEVRATYAGTGTGTTYLFHGRGGGTVMVFAWAGYAPNVPQVSTGLHLVLEPEDQLLAFHLADADLRLVISGMHLQGT